MLETKAPYSLSTSGEFFSLFLEEFLSVLSEELLFVLLEVFVSLPEMQISGGKGAWRTKLGIRSGS
jgi:hypothetical protein